MSKRKRLSFEEKLKACEYYDQGKGSYESIAKEFGISESGFYLLYKKYKEFGPEALKMQTKHKKHTKEFKEKVIDAYNNGEGSYPELARKYGIRNFSVIARWVLGCNGSNKSTYNGAGGVTIMARKTTLEERIKIVGYLIDNDIDYNQTSTHFKVSYQQVYTWYRKYLKHGVEGLVDNRGKKKQDHELSEIELLKRENERLKREIELSNAAKIVLKKTRIRGRNPLTRVRNEESYKTVNYFKDTYEITWLCDIVGVSRSSYYKWLNRKKPDYEIKNERVLEEILECYKMSNKTYGYRRIRINLNRYTNSNHSLNYFYRLMNSYGIKSIIRRKRPGYKKSTPDYIAENILARDFTTTKPNEKWLSDVTEFKATNGQKLYLCGIMDLYDNSIVSYTTSTTPNNQQLYTTFNQAMELNPGAKPVFHSDRGYQYTSIYFKSLLEKHGIIHSMSRVGKCIDNGPIENLWGIIKTEMFYINSFNNIQEIEKSIKNYIEFYNRQFV